MFSPLLDAYTFNDFLEDNIQVVLIGIFGILIVAFLVLDLGFFNRKAHVVSIRAASLQSIFWVVVSLLFGLLIYAYYDKERGLQYYSGYLTEKALSVDNIFVIILILKFFQIEKKYYHKILFWGILGAILMRGAFIFLGAQLIEQFEWILYFFGFFLVYTGIKMFTDKSETKESDLKENKLVKFVRRYLKYTDNHEGKFFRRMQDGVYATPLFLVIVLIESTDLIFAVDSIPAIFSIVKPPDELIIYTSNIFAVMGLRAMFFLLSGVMDRFHYLQHGLSLVLIFVGGKMLMELIPDLFLLFGGHEPGWALALAHPPEWLSLSIIALLLGGAVALSYIMPHPGSIAPSSPKGGEEGE